jgi:hypothetical protein
MAREADLFCRDRQILDAHPHGVMDGVGNGRGEGVSDLLIWYPLLEDEINQLWMGIL